MPPIAPTNFFFGMAATAETEAVAVTEDKGMEVVKYTPRTHECDFDKEPTELYLLLQKKDWDASIARASTDPVEARTWVCRREAGGKLRWRLLPLHAAIIFKAPENVIESLLASFPLGVESKDDQGMLPLHLAFRNGSTEGVVNLLLVAYPQSIDVKDRKGRIPLVLAQASTSPNRDAFMTALERGPTYYAIAAAATERAAVTAELRAIFDAKLVAIKSQHLLEVKGLKNDSANYSEDFTAKINELETELAKTKETSQVLVDHVNTLEAQLTSRGDTERFLATKIATLDSSLQDASRVREETETTLGGDNKILQVANGELTRSLAVRNETVAILSIKLEETTTELNETTDTLRVTKEKSVEEIQRLEMEWATSRANSAVLEAQLKKKIDTEHTLATQVSSLAAQLAESAAESSNVSSSYAQRVESLMTERATLRSTITELTKKLTFVAEELQNVSSEQDKIIDAAACHERTMEQAAQTQAKILENANHHEIIVEQVNEERRKILDVLIQQEKNILDSANERKRLKEVIMTQFAQVETSQQERSDLINRVNQQKEDVRKIVEHDLSIIPKSISEGMDQAELVDEVVKRTALAKDESTKSASEAKKDALLQEALAQATTEKNDEILAEAETVSKDGLRDCRVQSAIDRVQATSARDSVQSAMEYVHANAAQAQWSRRHRAD